MTIIRVRKRVILESFYSQHRSYLKKAKQDISQAAHRIKFYEILPSLVQFSLDQMHRRQI